MSFISLWQLMHHFISLMKFMDDRQIVKVHLFMKSRKKNCVLKYSQDKSGNVRELY